MSTKRRIGVIPTALLGALLAPALGWAAYAGVTWMRFGRTTPRESSDPVMDRYMPEYDIAEVHQTRVSAPAPVTYRAALATDLQRSRIVNAIFRGREILLRAAPDARPEHFPLIDELLSLGWGVLEEVPERQIVLGAITQPWKADVVFRALAPSEFESFDAAGYVKIVVTFAADPSDTGGSIFRTETRAAATDEESRAKFRRYWSVFSPGIRLIRTRTLATVRRDAEALATR